MKLARPLCLLLSLALLAAARPAVAQRARPPRNAQTDIERKINALIARMTLAEKLGQLQQLDGEGNGNFRPEHRDLVRKGLLGSTLNVRGVARTNELQHIAMDESRLKIPLIFGFDVIHGYRTIFPVPLGETSSWDAAAVERAASIAADEARAAGVHWTFAPMLDIARDARWGRIVEGAGEDPYLGAAMARARVRGFQGTDYSAPTRVVACAKRLAAYGVAAREMADSWLVVLKNVRETLSLSASERSIAVIGPLADSQEDMLGSWNGDGHTEDAVTLLVGLK